MMQPRSIFGGTKTWKRRDPQLPPTPQVKWNRENRQKLEAHEAVRRALRDGTLKRGKCEVCGSFTVEAHHDDYAKPLEVRWLCRGDHQRHHAALRRAAA